MAAFSEAAQCLEIEEIVWIDDDYSNKDGRPENLIEQILATIEVANEDDLERIGGISAFCDIDFSMPREMIMEDVGSLLSLEATNIKSVAEQLEIAESEYTDSDRNVIIESIKSSGIRLHTYSMRDWQGNKENHLAAGPRVLFLVDKEFSKEGGSKNGGIEILRELLSRAPSGVSSPCILFTHTCNNAVDEEALRKQIFDDFKSSGNLGSARSYDFQVLSKGAALDRESAESRFLSCVRAVFVRRTFSFMANGLCEKIIGQVRVISDQLIQANVYELDNVIFGSSLREGMSEVELLHRIFLLGQKRALNEYVSEENAFVGDLMKLRRLQLAGSKSDRDGTDTYNDFKQLRIDEHWLEGRMLNGIFSPISCGDVFSCDDELYILLSQPCDTIVRADGRRGSCSSVLAPLRKRMYESNKKLKEGLGKTSGETSYVFRETGLDLSFWEIELNRSVLVSLESLDLCSYNESGRVEFKLDQSLPLTILSPGQIARFNRLKECAAQADGFPNRIRIEDQPLFPKCEVLPMKLEFDAEASAWSSKLVRTRRLENPYAEHALNKYFLYKSRKAFDHDFTGRL